MEEYHCKDCKFFIQHYRKVGRKFVPVFAGHCIAKRIKHRKQYDKVCEAYEASSKENV